MNKKKFSSLIVALIILLDQVTKFMALNKNIEIIPNILSFNYTQNTGVAFGIGNNMTLIVITNIIMIIGIAIFIILKFKKINYTTLLALYLIVAGGVSNLIDRIFRGYVIDFIDVNLLSFPNFNIADIFITIGFFVLIIELMREISRW